MKYQIKLAAQLFLIALASSGRTAKTLDFDVNVPIDYLNPKAGKTRISYELGADFSIQKPTVFIVTDAQQFYIRKGTVAQLQSSLFDSSFNVVGVINRDNNEDLKKMVLDKDGKTDWVKAFDVFSWVQYVNDIDAVRKKLLGINGKILLYGQSGGGFLAHQYLSMYGRYVDRAFTAAAVNYDLDHELGINHDKFWDEVTKESRYFSDKFVLLNHGKRFPRELIAMLFQRQNFYEKPDSLQFEREKLLYALLNNDTISIKDYKEKYQINAIQSFYASADGIPIKVRLFEFILPLLDNFKIKSDTLLPNMENLFYSSLPLIDAYNKKQIKPKSMDLSNLNKLNTDVFILSGRWDHTADYRSQIALAYLYPNHCLFIAYDNHAFFSLKGKKLYSQLLTAFLKNGAQNQLTQKILLKSEPFRWKE